MQCANGFLLNTMIRQRWNQPNALVTTDCGAVSNIMGHLEPSPGNGRGAATAEEAAAWTIMNGAWFCIRAIHFPTTHAILHFGCSLFQVIRR
jgi:hypothetical protein|eukprot:COSAG01_NODE_1187_length_11337_cov_185.267574_11_plen_92_part_00